MEDGSISFNAKNRWSGQPLELNCGRCIGCKIERSRQWSIRIMHESMLWDMNSFTTLTYNDEHLPDELKKKHVQAFFKSLRKTLERKGRGKIRYYAVGEYGDRTKRPHYHLCIFNYWPPDAKLIKNEGENPIYSSSELSNSWPYGFTSTGKLTGIVTGKQLNIHK